MQGFLYYLNNLGNYIYHCTSNYLQSICNILSNILTFYSYNVYLILENHDHDVNAFLLTLFNHLKYYSSYLLSLLKL